MNKNFNCNYFRAEDESFVHQSVNETVIYRSKKVPGEVNLTRANNFHVE